MRCFGDEREMLCVCVCAIVLRASCLLPLRSLFPLRRSRRRSLVSYVRTHRRDRRRLVAELMTMRKIQSRHTLTQSQAARSMNVGADGIGAVGDDEYGLDLS